MLNFNKSQSVDFRSPGVSKSITAAREAAQQLVSRSSESGKFIASAKKITGKICEVAVCKDK